MQVNGQIIFEERPVNFVRIENFSNFSEKGYSVENLVLITRNGNDDWHFDYGALCFRKRTQTNKLTHSAKVVKETFHPEMAKALKNYLSDQIVYLAVKGSFKRLSRIRVTVNDLYELSEKYRIELKFDDINKCHLIYEKYTSILLDKVREGLSDPEFISSAKYADQQKICYNIIASNCDLSGKSFKEKYAEIKSFSSRNKEKKVYSEEEYSVFVNHCKKLYYFFSDFILNQDNLPIIIDIKNADRHIYKYVYIIKTPNGQHAKYFIDSENGRFLSRLETVENVKKIENISELPVRFKKTEEDLPWALKNSYDLYENSILRANELNSKERLKVINLAVASMATLLIMDSGCNQSAIFELKVSDIANLKNDTANHKLITRKARAGGKKVSIPITKKMVKSLKDYEKFRERVLNEYGEELKSLINDSLFFGFTLDQCETIRDMISPISIKDFLNYKLWYFSVIGKDTWINPKDARCSNSNIVQNLEEGVDFVAERLGHTESINIKHYTEATKEQTHAQMTNFFNEVYGQMIFNSRDSEKLIPVITDLDSKTTIAGHCVNSEPARAEGFNENIETPNCSNPASCLFCKDYVVVTEEADIRKLLSLRKITELHPNQNDEMQIVKYRVDEILKYIVEKNDQLLPLISSINDEVDQGYLDEHWESLMELFGDLGVDFYA
ncbi:hypothetical protein KTJ53_04865 [Acinetobacter variabilis]|uniref:hypothetical protein n=1 Tax=Acinetobacter variabilis TaxID=70346 RepID=UPI0021D3117D|nr:hypothetical protein [Acinetobacter variabilis]MCU4629035.1 hypothetical protein [Acinetobacter variabilis]